MEKNVTTNQKMEILYGATNQLAQSIQKGIC